MRRRGDLCHVAQQLHVLRTVVERVVADQHAERLAAELAVFLFVYLLEDRALVPCRAAELAQRAAKLLLRDVQHLDLVHEAVLDAADQEIETAPGGLHLLEVRVMQDHVQLLAQPPIDRRDRRLDDAA